MALLSKDVADIESLLALNPTIHHNATWKPSVVTKVEKKKWKRNQDKQCSVSVLNGSVKVRGCCARFWVPSRLTLDQHVVYGWK